MDKALLRCEYANGEVAEFEGFHSTKYIKTKDGRPVKVDAYGATNAADRNAIKNAAKIGAVVTYHG